MSEPTGQSDPTKTENAPRDCGGCNVCCTAMRVTPLDKPAGTPCRHESPQGCGIYQTRPEVCRVWFCLWVRDDRSIFNDDHRPDQLGVFFTASEPNPRTGAQSIRAHEIRPAAAEEPEAAKVIEHLRQFAPVIVLPYRPPITDVTVDGRPAA